MWKSVVRTGFGTKERVGWVLYDWANSAFILCVITVIGAQYFVYHFEAAARSAGDLHVGPAPAMMVLGLAMPAEAVWSFCMSAAALTVVILSPIAGALADDWGVKKRFLMGYCALGVVACLALSFPIPWWSVALLIVVGMVGFEGGNVFYNAFLPDIADAKDQGAVSTVGFAAGYLGGVLALILALILFTDLVLNKALGSIRLSFGLVGVWWGGFALITFAFLRDRPVARPPYTPLQAVRGAFVDLGHTIKLLTKHPQALRFLLSYLLFNDGVATLISNVTPYAMQNIYLDAAKTQHIGTAQLVYAIILVQLVALPGSILCGWIAQHIGDKITILLTLLVFTFGVAYGQIASLVTEFYVMAGAVGVVLGGCQALSRSLYASFVPEGRNAEFFAFFAMSDKVSAMLGPLTYGAILTMTGNTRYALASLSVFFLLGGALLTSVNVAKGQEFARSAS